MKIIIFHGGSIGDTLMAFPAIECIRNNYKDARIDLFSCPGVNDFSYLNFYENTGLVDDVKRFYIPPGNAARLPVYSKLFLTVLRGNYDMVVCLLPWHRNQNLDRLFFRLGRVRRVVYPVNLPAKKDISLPRVPFLMLKGLADNGFSVPEANDVSIKLKITPTEQENAARWLDKLNIPSGHIPIAIGMGGKKPVCLWPQEKYHKVLEKLSKNHHIFPIFFGGKADGEAARELIVKLKTGAFAADGGNLSLRETVAALGFCQLFIGNDTGTVHMAAAAGIPIIGIYSAHNYEGLWHPLGKDNAIFRKELECRGCDKLICTFGTPAKCIDMIEAQEVAERAMELLNEKHSV
ncbi:MAG: glycosyltransferase family 9 protein [Victivallales bacterium]|nr:glycosyltransferase family 9 protein [Victivallales bacterium]